MPPHVPLSSAAIETLTLPEQVAQMVVVRASGHLFDHQITYPVWEPPAATLQHWLQRRAVGGVILLGGSAGEIAWRSQQLQSWARFPLLLAADIEEGVGQRFAGATWFPPPMALGAIARRDLNQSQGYAAQLGAQIAREAQAIGLNWVLAPVVDVNNNPRNPVINVRAFGELPGVVSALATAFIRGARNSPVLTTAKHFPGHGDTAVDSHLDLPVLPHTEERLARIELPPFQAAIAAGVDAVMSAHLRFPAWDPEHPATLSRRILTQELRQRLGFSGLIVTDALVMAGIAEHYDPEEAAIRAVEAGADILLMPLNPEATVEAVCQAVQAGRLPPEGIRESVERIWQAKRQVCPPANPVSLPSVMALAQPQAIATAAAITQAAMQVRGCLDLDTAERGRNLIIVDETLNCPFLGFNAPAIARPRQLGYRLQIVDSHTSGYSQQGDTDAAQPTLLQLFIRGNPWRGSAGLTQVAQTWFEALLKAQSLQALVIYGSPYVLDQFLPALPLNVPYVFTYGQMPAAQAIALEALIPGQAQ